MNKIWVIAKNVYTTQVKKASFILMVLAPFIMAGIVLAILYFGSHQNQAPQNIAIVTEDTNIVQMLKATDTQNQLSFDANEQEASRQLIDKKIDGYLKINSSAKGVQIDAYTLSGQRDLNYLDEKKQLANYFLGHLLQELHLSQGDILTLITQPVQDHAYTVAVDEHGNLSTETDSLMKKVRIGIAFAFSILSFLILAFYIQLFATEIAKEKGTRVMEIILSSMTAMQHFAGKMLGILLMIATHIGIYVVLLAAFLLVNHHFQWISLDLFNQYGVDLPTLLSSQRPMLFWGWLFSTLALFIYLTITGFLVSLAEKMEDAQQLNAPLIMLMVVSYYIAAFAVSDPYNLFVKVASFIPFWTPFIVTIRIATNSISGIELAGTILAALVFLALGFWLVNTFYKSNTLTYSDKGLITRFKKSLSLYRSEKQSHQS